MLKELLRPEISELVENRKWEDLKESISQWPPVEIVDLLLDMEESERVLLFRFLPRDISADIFAEMEPEDQDELIKEMTDHETRTLLADMSPDDRTDLFEELPANVTRKLMMLLSPADLKEARWLLGYPEDSIGRAMTPDFIAVKPHWTITKTLDHIRRFGKDSETVYRIYVVDKSGKLLDDILLRNIIIASPDATIESLMDNQFISLSAFDDKEITVQALEKYDLLAIPVVDSQGVLVGIVTFDDVMDISEEEATEDFQKTAAINPVEQPYLNASIMKLWMKRLPWLIVLLLMNFITAEAMSFFENVLNQVVALAFFIPLIIGTAGNSGTQSSTLIIRSLATGDVEFSDWLRVLMKEIIVGLLLGVSLALITMGRGLIGGEGSMEVAIVVSLTIVVLVLWANIVGGLLPILFSKIKVDPAVISSPFIATIIDVTGIVIYLRIAIWFLELSY
jgi:magnesium transporter